MGKKGWIIFIAIAVVLVGGLIYLSGQNKIDVSEFDANAVISANEKNGNIGDHVFGQDDSKVVLIEYGDYQCPGCGSAYQRVKDVTEKYKDQITFVFRNLPLTSIHPNARFGAAAAEAAGLQGKYWEMHDLLYENQNAWSGASSSERGEVFKGYAQQLGLNIDTFTTDISSSVISQKISFDQAIFKSTGHPQVTPTFIMNGELVDSADWGDDAALDAFVKQKIQDAGIALPGEDAATTE
jgi:protein-disulfide isomerase